MPHPLISSRPLPRSRPAYVAFAASLCLCGSALSDTDQPPALALERVRPAVVTITAGAKFGTGFLVSPDGTLVTAWHVVAGTSAAQVRLPGGRRYDVAGVLRADPARDFAVLRLDTAGAVPNLPCVELGSVSRVRPGDPVFCVGSPMGREQSVTTAVVAGVRNMPGPNRTASRQLQLIGALRPGISGGPVADERGAVIGIAQGGIVGGAGVAELGYAAAIDDVGEVRQPGARVRPLREATRVYVGGAEDLFAQGCEVLRRADLAIRSAQPGASPGPEALEQAMRLFARAADARPDFVSACTNAGSCALRLHRTAEAIGYFRRSLRVAPQDTLTLYSLAIALANAGQAPEAIRTIRDLERTQPAFAPAYFLCGRLSIDLHRPQDAVPELQRALQLQPDYPLALLALAEAYDALNRTQDAIATLDLALRRSPGLAAADRLLGVEYMRQNEPRRAVVAFRRAVTLAPGDAASHYDLALAYLAIGDDVQAKRECDAVRRLDVKLADRLEPHLRR